MKMLFVVGLPRSGTSLLYALLNKHPGIAIMYEAEMRCLPRAVWALWGRKGAARRVEFWNNLFSRHGLEPEAVPRGVDGRDAAAHWLYEQVLQRKGALWGGEKAPHYSGRIHQLARRYPEARFIVISRDLASTVASALQAGANGDHFFSSAGRLARNFSMARSLYVTVARLPDRERRILHIQYDELTADPAKECRRVCDFLGLPWHPEMARLRGADRSALPPGDHHMAVRSDTIRASGSSAPTPDFAFSLCAKCDEALSRARARSLNGDTAFRLSVSPPALLATRLKGSLLLRWDSFRQATLALLPLRTWQFVRSLRRTGGSGLSARPWPLESPPKSTALPNTLALRHLSASGGTSAADVVGASPGCLLVLIGDVPADPASHIKSVLSRDGVESEPVALDEHADLETIPPRVVLLNSSTTQSQRLTDLSSRARARGWAVGVAYFNARGHCSLGIPA